MVRFLIGVGDEVYQLLDYERVFCADGGPGADVFDLRAICRPAGCMVVVRPDQHVAAVIPRDDRVSLSEFFSAFLKERQ